MPGRSALSHNLWRAKARLITVVADAAARARPRTAIGAPVATRSDFTGGCTIEARGFEALHNEFLAADTEVIGISADSVDDHESFCDSEGLSFPLLSDPDGAVSKAYGSWMAPYSLRHSFLIDPDGILRERWVAVRPSGHAKEVLESIKSFQSNALV